MSENLTTEVRDRLLFSLVRSCTNLEDKDIRILMEVSHSLPFISNLENGDTYINVLTKSGKSMVIAQYRNQYCDLYKRDIIGELVEKADEPAVYRALEHGLSGRGLIGIIDKGRVVVRHTVSPIYNDNQQIIGSLTYEYPNTSTADTEPIRIRNTLEGKASYVHGPIDKVAGYLQDGLLIFSKSGECTFANAKADELYRGIGYEGSIVGRRYEEVQLTKFSLSSAIKARSVIKEEVRLGDYIFDESISTIWEDGVYEGIAVVLQDKTKMQQLENEISYRIASINEVHHRVKNNLQTIIGLVGLEAAQSENAEVKAFSKTIISRICSISATYDLLSHTGADTVNLKNILDRVAEGSLGNCNSGECKVSATVNGGDLELAAGVASTVALVVNELMQNSLKYAFRGRDFGVISLVIEPGDKYSLVTVSDNGCGFDEKADKSLNSGLGLKLVDNLVKSSLRGDITVTSSNLGTITRFSFRNAGKK